MKISRAKIEGYRCVESVEVDIDSLTAIVGSGGVGKSTILSALDWFFRGGDLEERDLHLLGADGEHMSEVLVAVTFSDLNDDDRAALGAYVDGETTTLTRSWSQEEGQKLSGNALAFEPFEEVRAAVGGIEVRARYKALFEERGEELGLPKPVNKREEVERIMEVWERSNPEQCELRSKDARHLGGFTGTPLLQSRFDYVLVGARAGAPEALGGGRDSVLERLLSMVEELSEQTTEKIVELQEKAQGEIRSLMNSARGRELLELSANLTRRVADYFPGAAVKLKEELAPPSPPKLSVRALVSDRGGFPMDPDLQGHGLQRALVISLLHELAEVDSRSEAEGSGRSLMLAIEEPELYQHPLQARALATTLEHLAESSGERPIQVAYSTHSPYFTRPALFDDLRLCRRIDGGGTTCVAADPTAIEAAVAASGYPTGTAERVERALAENLREAIFARAVVLCEGASDRATLEGVGDLQGGLDRDGVAVAHAGGKSSLIVAIAILAQLEIPFVALFDADVAGSLDSEKQLNEQILRACGEEEQAWPEREVRARSANFADTIEADLEEIWPKFSVARQEVADELGVKSGSKEDRVYREAAQRAGEPPEFIVSVLDVARAAAK